jgi:GTPase
VTALRETIVALYKAAMVEDQCVTLCKAGMLSEIYEKARVLSEDYDITGRIIRVHALPGAIARLRRARASP